MSVSAPPARRTGIRTTYQAILLATVAALVLGACSSGGGSSSQPPGFNSRPVISGFW